MSMIIRKGTAEDLDAVEKLYGEVCGHMAATVNYCGWKCGIFCPSFLASSQLSKPAYRSGAETDPGYAPPQSTAWPGWGYGIV